MTQATQTKPKIYNPEAIQAAYDAFLRAYPTYAQTQLLLSDYVQHYGLRRGERAPGFRFVHNDDLLRDLLLGWSSGGGGVSGKR